MVQVFVEVDLYPPQRIVLLLFSCNVHVAVCAIFLTPHQVIATRLPQRVQNNINEAKCQTTPTMVQSSCAVDWVVRRLSLFKGMWTATVVYELTCWRERNSVLLIRFPVAMTKGITAENALLRPLCDSRPPVWLELSYSNSIIESSSRNCFTGVGRAEVVF